MIISHKHKFIFIKTAKTAGTSVEVDLNQILGADDVATPIFPTVEGHIAKNFSYRKFGMLPRKLYNHMPASEVRDYIGKRKFNDYFVFCVEREPVDKCASHYSMLINSQNHNEGTKTLTFDQYINKRVFPVDTSKYTDRDGTLMVNRILRYEQLAEELREVCDLLGFDINLNARAKSGFRINLSVTREQSAIIYEAFASSNIHTGYSL